MKSGIYNFLKNHATNVDLHFDIAEKNTIKNKHRVYDTYLTFFIENSGIKVEMIVFSEKGRLMKMSIDINKTYANGMRYHRNPKMVSEEEKELIRTKIKKLLISLKAKNDETREMINILNTSEDFVNFSLRKSLNLKARKEKHFEKQILQYLLESELGDFSTTNQNYINSKKFMRQFYRKTEFYKLIELFKQTEAPEEDWDELIELNFGT